MSAVGAVTDRPEILHDEFPFPAQMLDEVDWSNPGIRESTMSRWVAYLGCSLPMIVCVVGLIYYAAAR